MTTAQIIAMVRQFISYDLDVYPGVNPADEDITVAINNSLQDLGTLCNLRETAIPLTLTDAAPAIFKVDDYSVVPREFVRVYDCIINGTMCRDASGGDYGPWSLQELERKFPTWRTDPPGTPFAFVWAGNSTIILYPSASDSVVAAGNHFLSGQVLPLPLDSTQPTVVPLLPTRLHEALARHAAARLARSHVTEGQQIARINAMRTDAENQAMAEGKRNDNASSSWGSTSNARVRNSLCL